MLQTHGRLTVEALAGRLETSERTIRRDLDALCVAGVPLYSQRGRGGGWSLLGGHRIDLTGLTAEEAQALFFATGPGSPLGQAPGVDEGLTAARRKVLAALPEPLRAQVEAAAAAVLVDQSRWGTAPPAAAGRDADAVVGSHLRALRAAVLAGVEVIVGYEPPGRPPEERRLKPHGLVYKRGVWYLVATAAAGLRTYRLSRVRSVVVTGEPVERPEGFDLAEVWSGVQRSMSARVPATLAVDLVVDARLVRRLQATVGAWWPMEHSVAGEDGRSRVTIRFPGVEVAVAELVGFAEHTEVVSPEEVRAELAAFGRRLVARYGEVRALPR